METIKATKIGNYGRVPTIDVKPVYDSVRVDLETGEPLNAVVVDTALGFQTEYYRADGTRCYRVSSKCAYCGSTDPKLVKYVQHNWYDAIECDRCGGVQGWSIGD